MGDPRYNSVNYQLLAQLISTVTGRSFAQAVRDDLLEPAGLERTWLQSAETPTAPSTVGVPTASADIVDEAGSVHAVALVRVIRRRCWLARR